MPEKTLWTRHVGMEALNSVGSTGSCDSMESISSNHSAFSGEGYDHLSAEERECLMFLEETIDSLDNEDDSGVSNDELETTEKSTSHSATEPTKVLASDGNDKMPKQMPTAFPKLEQWAYVAKIPQGYHSFPRIIQASREETTKHTTDTKLPESTSDQKSWHGKPKSLSSITKPQPGEPHISDLLIIPPPEPFRDPQVIDKRRSVTDPTDAREVRYDRALFKPATITEYKELQHVVRPHSAPAPSLFPRVSSPKTDTGSQATFSQAEEKSVEAKQGPPTAPKPRTLPPHIVIKSSSGMVSSLDPQNRPRTFSAHERIMDRTIEHTIPKVPHSKEQERARFEALHKLGLDVKSGSQENLSMRSSKTDLSQTQGVGDHGYKDANRKSVGQQDKVDSMGDIPAPPSIIIHKIEEVRKESLNKNRLSIKSNSLEKDEPATGTAPQKEPYVVEVPPQHHIKSSFFGISRPSIKVNTQEKADDIIIPSPKPLNEVHTTTDGPPKNIEADPTKHTSPSHSRPQTKDAKSDKPGNPDHELHTGPDVALRSPKRDVDQKPSALKTIPVEKGTVPEMNPAPLKPTGEKPQEILGSVENISLISTSPGKTFSFPRPKEVVVQHSPEVVKVRGNDKVPDKSNRHSTHFEAPNEPYLRFPQGSVPGLRQINIKSNTLERSGVGLSGSMPSLEKESQKSSSSFFKRPLFSGGFLRNNRPRPASLGTGKDFANLEPSTSEAETTEKRSFFSRPARSSAPVTSVKITPKGTSEEHRKEALKKLGILKE